MAALCIPNNEEFRAAWAAGVSGPDLAEKYGVSTASIYAAARRYGLPGRGRGRVRSASEAVARMRRTSDAAPAVSPHDDPSGNARSGDSGAGWEGLLQVVRGLRQRGDVPELPGWTDTRDARVICAAGRYAEMAHWAGCWNVPVQSVICRWHRLRRAVDLDQFPDAVAAYEAARNAVQNEIQNGGRG